MIQKDSNILICISNVKKGGAETQAINLALGLKQQGYNKVIFLILNSEKEGPVLQLLETHRIQYTQFQFSTYQIDYFKSLPFSFSEIKLFFRTKKMLGKIKAYVKQINPYVIIPFTYYPNIVAIYLKEYTQLKTGIWNQRDLGVDGFNKNIFENKALIKADKFVANSKLGKFFLENKGVDAEKITVINNAINNIPDKSTLIDWREKLGIPVGGKILLKVSNIQPNKDHLTVLKAYVELVKNIEFYENTYMVFAGRIDEKFAQPLYDIINLHQLQNRVKFIGFVEDTNGLIKASDVFVFSSHSEGSPNAVLEALALGKPTLATKLEPIVEITGANYPYLYQAGNVTELHTKLQSILNKLNDDIFFKIKNRINVDFTIDKMTDSYLRIIASYEN